MNNEELNKQLKAILKKFEDEIHPQIVNTINEYKEENPDTNFYSVEYLEGVRLLDDLALLTAWALDKLDNRVAFPSSPQYNGSVTKKIRKALGYTL